MNVLARRFGLFGVIDATSIAEANGQSTVGKPSYMVGDRRMFRAFDVGKSGLENPRLPRNFFFWEMHLC